MKTLYLDKKYCIHLNPTPNTTIIQTSIFDNIENFDAFAEYYRYIPLKVGKWVSETGDIFYGGEFRPIDKYSLEIINSFQKQYYLHEQEHINLVAELVELAYQDGLEVIG